MLCPFIVFFFIKPDGRYHCSMPGCSCSFELLGNFVKHLEEDHNFSDEMIEEILEIIAF